MKRVSTLLLIVLSALCAQSCKKDVTEKPSQVDDKIYLINRITLSSHWTTDVQELSYEEISQIVNIPLGTVKSRVNRGRLKLQEKLCGLMKIE